MQKVSVLYFGQIREQLGYPQQWVELSTPCTVSQLWQMLHSELDLGQNVLVAVNQAYVKADHVVTGGEEVAFFPPVTGG